MGNKWLAHIMEVVVRIPLGKKKYTSKKSIQSIYFGSVSNNSCEFGTATFVTENNCLYPKQFKNIIM